MPTLAVGMSWSSRGFNMPTASVGMAPDLLQQNLSGESEKRHAMSGVDRRLFLKVAVGAPVFASVWNFAGGGGASASEVLMKDGRILQGKLGALASLADVPKAPPAEGAGPLQLIVLLDDDLRRIFFSKYQYREIRPGAMPVEEKFKVWQNVRHGGLTVAAVGPVLDPGKFDAFGRRTFVFATSNGKVSVVQGITEITPHWSKVEGISHMWVMRIATSSIPRDTLQQILLKQIDQKNIEHHKKIARFYLQAERYEEAGAQLEAMLKQFPDQPNLQADLEGTIQEVRKQAAQRLLAELRLRRDAGQHRLVTEKLKKFPNQNVAGEVLQAVREMLEEYTALEARRVEIIRQLEQQFGLIDNPASRKEIEPILKEITTELDLNTLVRLAAFRQNVDDPNMKPAEKLALAISGWLLGADEAVVKLSTALSLYKVRGLVRQYVNETQKTNREQIFDLMRSEEAAAPALVAGLLANMKPAVEPPAPVDPEKMPGAFNCEVVGLPGEPKLSYLVQLPPEYSPHRRYPAVVTLPGSGTTPEQQVDWWAGGWTREGWRAGQATRQGYIVIAPQWLTEHQKQYNFSAREHAAVLGSLRDACRRFAIDTDRVFLSGHSLGGDAAWDIGLAHPDLWAGVVLIEGEAARYCSHYWKNAKYVPFYVVYGELDGGKLTRNARDLDRYLKAGYNITVVEYQGRGPEHFYDEVLRIFDWMGRLHRDFYPRSFACSTMREFDNFFWWLECGGLPAKAMVNPVNWPPPRGTTPVTVGGEITEGNSISVHTGTSKVTIWLSPKMIDFKARVNVLVKGRRINSSSVAPDLQTLLEDVRTRGDRQHPFWAKVQTP